MSEDYVTVHRTYDPVQADMLGDIMRENDIFARVLGTRHGAAIGVSGLILQLRIEVPRSQAGEATDLLEAFFAGADEALLHEEAGFELEDPEAAPPDVASPDAARDVPDDALKPMFAAGLSLILGVVAAGHIYARRRWTACLLITGQAVAISNLWSPYWADVAMGLVMGCTILTLDLAGSQVAVRAYNRGRRVTPPRQLVTGAAFLLIAGVAGIVTGPHVPEPRQREVSDPHESQPHGLRGVSSEPRGHAPDHLVLPRPQVAH